MKPRVVICDDERLARERLVRLLEDIGGYELVGLAEHGEAALKLVQEYQPDIILMDMRMPVMDGLSCARQLGEMEAPPAIIFCTAFDEHALEAFSVQASGYVLKPVSRESLREALARACRVNQLQLENMRQQPVAAEQSMTCRSHITARTHRGIELIPIDEIRYFLADHKYVTVRHEHGEVLIDETLKELEEESVMAKKEATTKQGIAKKALAKKDQAKVATVKKTIAKKNLATVKNLPAKRAAKRVAT